MFRRRQREDVGTAEEVMLYHADRGGLPHPCSLCLGKVDLVVGFNLPIITGSDLHGPHEIVDLHALGKRPVGVCLRTERLGRAADGLVVPVAGKTANAAHAEATVAAAYEGPVELDRLVGVGKEACVRVWWGRGGDGMRERYSWLYCVRPRPSPPPF